MAIIVFVTSTEAELFAIKCSINQAYSKENISKIIVVTDSIHAAKKIFDDKTHPYQIHMTAILCELWQFFTVSQENSIKFGNAPAVSNRDFTSSSTKIQSRSILSPYSQVNYLGITAKKLIVIASSIFGR